jgi:hypothetical protein
MNNEDDVYFYSSSSKSAIGDRATSRLFFGVTERTEIINVSSLRSQLFLIAEQILL